MQQEGVRLAASSLWSTAREPSRSAFFNIFVNDVNYSAGSSSLRLYADDTTQYIAHESPCTLESTLNQDIESIKIEPTLKILGVTLDWDLSFKPHVAIMLKKAYAKIAALRRIKRLVPSDVMISLYKAYVLSQLEYCCPLLRRISNALKNNIERINHYYNVYG